MTDIQFLDKFYKWKTEYWAKDDSNIELEDFEKDDLKKYRIWRMKIIDKDIESLMLYGVRNNKIIGISFTDNNKENPKSKTETIEYLKSIYLKK